VPDVHAGGGGQKGRLADAPGIVLRSQWTFFYNTPFAYANSRLQARGGGVLEGGGGGGG